MAGWIKIHRKLQNKPYFKNAKKLQFWILLLIKANHEPKKERFAGKDIVCKPGQFTTGRKQLAEEAGISESAVNRLLSYFEKTEQQIEQQTSTTNRLISIVNWHEYQIDDNKSDNKKKKSGQQTEHTLRSKEEYSIVRIGEKKEKNEKSNGDTGTGAADYFGRNGNKRPSDYLGTETYKPGKIRGGSVLGNTGRKVNSRNG